MTVHAKPCGFRTHLGNRFAIATFPPPRRLLDSFNTKSRKELSSAISSGFLQAHSSIGKDSYGRPGRVRPVAQVILRLAQKSPRGCPIQGREATLSGGFRFGICGSQPRHGSRRILPPDPFQRPALPWSRRSRTRLLPPSSRRPHSPPQHRPRSPPRLLPSASRTHDPPRPRLEPFGNPPRREHRQRRLRHRPNVALGHGSHRRRPPRRANHPSAPSQ